MPTYAVEAIDDVTIAAESPIDGMELMSPYVWREDGRYRMLVRGVPDPLGPHDPTGLIACGASDDGLAFALDAALAIAPGPDAADAGGCEDPTVVTGPDGYVVYYTGVDAARSQGSLIAASGPSIAALVKRRVALEAPPGEGNIKEATLVQTPQGDWRLFYEYAKDNASRIGVAAAARLGEPWQPLADPLPIRADSWDNWHLSTGPVITPPGGGDPVMFYNGATADARWRIGWVSFDPGFTRVTGRGLEPMLVPPPARDRIATDIAFAASAVVEDDLIALYYSVEDRALRRAMVRHYR